DRQVPVDGVREVGSVRALTELRERRAAALEEGPHPELFRDLLCLVDAARGAGTITTPLGDESGDVARPRLPAALAVTLGELESAGHVAGGLVQFARCDVPASAAASRPRPSAA